MQNNVISTPIDELVNIVKENQNCSITMLRTKLRLPSDLIEKWLVILEEYKVIEVKYKGFEGYVKIHEEKIDEKIKDNLDIGFIKENFLDKAKDRGLTMDKIRKIWPSFIKEYELEIKKAFVEKSKKQHYEPARIEKAWEKYRHELEVL